MNIKEYNNQCVIGHLEIFIDILEYSNLYNQYMNQHNQYKFGYEFKIHTEIEQDEYDAYYIISVDYDFNILSIRNHPCMSRLDLDADETFEIFNNSMEKDIILTYKLSDLRKKMINEIKKDKPILKENNVKQFIKECLKVNKGSDIKTSDLFNAYKAFCRNIKEYPLGRNKFIIELKNCNIIYSENCNDRQGNRVRGFKDLSFVNMLLDRVENQ